MKEKNIPYPLLAKYFANQCSASEKENIEKWRNENPEHDQLFRKLREQWINALPDTDQFVIPDKAKVWHKIQAEIAEKKKQIALYPRSALIRAASVAAIIALVAGFSISYLFRDTEEQFTAGKYENIVLAPAGQKTQLILPDSTLVWLNSGSRLIYSYNYNVMNRTVTLEGEGYFDVKYNSDYPFIVKTDGIDVKVHGTAFNLKAYPDETTISVSLIRGSVSLLSSKDQRLLTYLEPNQAGIISKADLLCRVESCDAEVDAGWHLNKLKFEGAGTEELWKKLERWYGVNITYTNTNPSNKYWFTVKTESLTELLEMINKLTPIEYKLDGEEVMIRYK